MFNVIKEVFKESTDINQLTFNSYQFENSVQKSKNLMLRLWTLINIKDDRNIFEI